MHLCWIHNWQWEHVPVHLTCQDREPWSTAPHGCRRKPSSSGTGWARRTQELGGETCRLGDCDVAKTSWQRAPLAEITGELRARAPCQTRRVESDRRVKRKSLKLFHWVARVFLTVDSQTANKLEEKNGLTCWHPTSQETVWFPWFRLSVSDRKREKRDYHFSPSFLTQPFTSLSETQLEKGTAVTQEMDRYCQKSI